MRMCVASCPPARTTASTTRCCAHGWRVAHREASSRSTLTRPTTSATRECSSSSRAMGRRCRRAYCPAWRTLPISCGWTSSRLCWTSSELMRNAVVPEFIPYCFFFNQESLWWALTRNLEWTSTSISWWTRSPWIVATLSGLNCGKWENYIFFNKRQLVICSLNRFQMGSRESTLFR